jgi:hypothetical protein
VAGAHTRAHRRAVHDAGRDHRRRRLSATIYRKDGLGSGVPVHHFWFQGPSHLVVRTQRHLPLCGKVHVAAYTKASWGHVALSHKSAA